MIKDIVSAYNNGEYDKARQAFYKVLPLMRAMFLETNPIPVKAAMEMLGYCSGDLRLPLVPLSDENRMKLKKSMTDYGLKV